MAALLVEAASHLAVEGAVEGGVVSADQAFDRYVKEFEFAMEIQKLRREDIRDLVELTVGRMDIYHLVGALLLEFTIHFYCENHLVEDEKAPFWILLLFLISNVGAVGYLLFAVWLAMHASVAAHSLGVRLLLNFTRVTVPDPDQLRQIQKSTRLFSQLRDKLMGGILRSKDADASSIPKPSTASAAKFSAKSAGQFVRKPAGSVPLDRSSTLGGDAAPLPSADAASNSNLSTDMSAEALEPYDVESHKRRFQQEQGKWLSYDAYSRTCMALGINQMLQALSYYIVGPVASRTPSGAFISLLGVQVLSVLVLRLDATDERGRRICRNLSEFWVILLLQPLPPVLAGLLVMARTHGFNHDVADGLVTPCYVLHLLWLVFLMRAIAPNRDMLPKRLRTVCYLEVLEPEQQALAAEGARLALTELHAAKGALREAVRKTLDEESRLGMLSDQLRAGRLLEIKRARLDEALSEVRDSASSSSNCTATANAILEAEQHLRLFALWKEIPQAQARLQALRATKDWHGEDFDSRCSEFETFCNDLNLGMGSSATAGRSTTTTISHVEVPDPVSQSFGAGGVWVDTREGTHSFSAPEGNTISLAELRESHSNWMENASLARTVQQNLTHNPHADDHRNAIPADANPSKPLPWLTVKRFTQALALMWAVGLLVHLGRCLFEFEEHLPVMVSFKKARSVLDAHGIEVSWPSPAPLFEVSSMHCNRSALFVSGRFSSHIALRHASAGTCVAPSQSCGSVDPFAELTHHRYAALFSSSGKWQCLAAAENPSSWQLLPLTSTHSVGEEVPLPRSWRVVAALSSRCLPEACEEIWVAGWDGAAEVVVGTLRRESPEEQWRFQQRFAVHPDLSRCVGGAECLQQGPLGTTAYHDVRALHLGLREGRRTLLVLLGGGSSKEDFQVSSYVDAWDLTAGWRRGRWRLADSHTSMCSDGRDILLARPGPDGPVMAAAMLPELLREDVAAQDDYVRNVVTAV